MVWLFHLQLLPTTMLFLHSVIISQTHRSLFWLTTAMPLLRLPVFLMGVCAGILRVRQQENIVALGQVEDIMETKSILHDVLPWSLVHYSDRVMVGEKKSGEMWARRVDSNIVILIIIIIAGIWSGGTVNYISQFVCVNMQLVIIYGLTGDTGGMSYFTRLCRTKVARYLGNISMAVYLLHLTVKDYLFELLKLYITSPIDCKNNNNNSVYIHCAMYTAECQTCPAMFLSPWWIGLISLPVVFLVADLAKRFVETPAKSWLRHFS